MDKQQMNQVENILGNFEGVVEWKPTANGNVYVDFKPSFTKGVKTDDIVVIRNAVAIADALDEAGVPFQFRLQSRNIERDGGRQVTTYRTWLHFFIGEAPRTAAAPTEETNALKAQVSELTSLVKALLAERAGATETKAETKGKVTRKGKPTAAKNGDDEPIPF